jgi:hypothetical protein
LYQAKSGAASWNTGDHPLATDFRLQGQLDLALRKTVDYVLLVSKTQAKHNLLELRPSDLTNVEVQAIQYSETQMRDQSAEADYFVARNVELLEPLHQLIRPVVSNWSARQAFRLLLGTYCDAGNLASVRELLSDAAGDGDALIAFPGARYELPLHVTEILSALPKFSWSVSGFRFRFDFGGLKGSAAFECGTDAFCLFEKWVASCNPTGEDGSWKVVHELRREP